MYGAMQADWNRRRSKEARRRPRPAMKSSCSKDDDPVPMVRRSLAVVEMVGNGAVNTCSSGVYRH